MPLTWTEYAHVRDFAVLYSGGLDSTAVPLLVGKRTRGKIHLLTFKHSYGALFNEWSRRHVPELRRLLGERVEHRIVDLTETWNAIGARQFLAERRKWGGHWVCCLGCQEAMAAHTAIHCLEHGIANAFICSSVGGEYAAMSMPLTREKNAAFYARWGIRYNAPLLDLGIDKPEERRLLREAGIDPGWGVRRSHQGYQPICLLGFQHSLDIVLDAHTTYPADRVGGFLDDKIEVMHRVVREELERKGLDPDALAEANRARMKEEEAAMGSEDGQASRHPE